MQHEFGVSVDEFDQSKEEALIASSVQFCGFLFELKAGGHLPFECQTLWRAADSGEVWHMAFIGTSRECAGQVWTLELVQCGVFTL